ncbi:hypothetical protein KUTeg_020353 [Tegillarca granosa]|uniref:Uncharacterized protein n=1 Tax=Tegillarca granosa TaxID=220873 RepID=A0ABQ9EAD5_TEGGR|nr:hypothetical protein KUTeg_020353 [Tegillarca granosa]
MKVDLTSLKSVMNFIQEFKSSGRKLQTLVCNAGIGSILQTYTEDDNEMIFQEKQHGEEALLTIFILTKALVSVIAGFTRLFKKDEYLPKIMQMYSMNRRLKNSNVTVTSLHPGLGFIGIVYVVSNILNEASCSKNPYQGAETSINAVVNPKYERERDLYFQNCKPIEPKNNARNETYQEQLWQFTLDLLKDYLTDEIIEYLEGKKLHYFVLINKGYDEKIYGVIITSNRYCFYFVDFHLILQATFI